MFNEKEKDQGWESGKHPKSNHKDPELKATELGDKQGQKKVFYAIMSSWVVEINRIP